MREAAERAHADEFVQVRRLDAPDATTDEACRRAHQRPTEQFALTEDEISHQRFRPTGWNAGGAPRSGPVPVQVLVPEIAPIAADHDSERIGAGLCLARARST